MPKARMHGALSVNRMAAHNPTFSPQMTHPPQTRAYCRTDSQGIQNPATPKFVAAASSPPAELLWPKKIASTASPRSRTYTGLGFLEEHQTEY
jgi:hypothetical protein